MKKQLIVTEHTTTDDPFCEIIDMALPSLHSEFFGSLEEFKDQLDESRYEIVREVWS